MIVHTCISILKEGIKVNSHINFKFFILNDIKNRQYVNIYIKNFIEDLKISWFSFESITVITAESKTTNASYCNHVHEIPNDI